jgi:MFS family permease
MSMDITKPHNEQRLLWAGFFSIFAAGVGFSVRAGILGHWASQFGFTMSELGLITGGGLLGFGAIIIVGSLIADNVGYGKLMAFAFVMHVLSAILPLFAPQVYAWGGEEYGKTATYWLLYVAMFMFAIGNGMGEVVVNPMVAALFPRQKTHYLNVLHAGWPGGLIAGGLVAYLMNSGSIFGWTPFPEKVNWMIQMSMFLLPTLLYGVLMLGQTFPQSEASQAGTSYGEMLAQFASPILLLLLFIHALVGYVELGTDSWIGTITGSIMADPTRGLLLFIYTSGLMFALRFFAGPIEHAISPLGLLCLSGIFGAIGLTLLGMATSVIFCVVAATVYALGKTFLWPTMLAVASERFPKGGAIVIGAMGGIGMLSAGLLGGPGIGFKQDYYASQELKEKDKAVFDKFAAKEDNVFLGIHTRGLDGSKVGKLKEQRESFDKAIAAAKESKDQAKIAAAENELKTWQETEDGKAMTSIEQAQLHGGRMALTLTAAVPATMAVLYLLLMLYFKFTGGYKRVDLGTDVPSANGGEPALAGAASDHPHGITASGPATGIRE